MIVVSRFVPVAPYYRLRATCGGGNAASGRNSLLVIIINPARGESYIRTYVRSSRETVTLLRRFATTARYLIRANTACQARARCVNISHFCRCLPFCRVSLRYFRADTCDRAQPARGNVRFSAAEFSPLPKERRRDGGESTAAVARSFRCNNRRQKFGEISGETARSDEHRARVSGASHFTAPRVSYPARVYLCVYVCVCVTRVSGCSV